MGEFSVEFGTYGWFPELLPSEEGDSEEDSGDEGEEGEQGQGGTEVKEEVVEVKEEEEGEVGWCTMVSGDSMGRA